MDAFANPANPLHSSLQIGRNREFQDRRSGKYDMTKIRKKNMVFYMYMRDFILVECKWLVTIIKTNSLYNEKSYLFDIHERQMEGHEIIQQLLTPYS